MSLPRPEMHSRTPSNGSSSSGSSAHRMILEHILSYPGTYELPLRTMYALNSTPQTQPRPRSAKGNTQASNNDAAQQLTSSLMAELSQMPNQPNSLPPSFITSFVRKCFATELRLVDFPQALTGLDYLKDLEARRWREMKSALERLGIYSVDSELDLDVLADRYPAAADWYRGLDLKIRKVEALHAQLFIVLRRWILINELSLIPYSKHNCVAMLNTVYPPVMSKTLPARLDATALRNQRDGFFKYIQAVERQGTGILANLIAQDRRPGEETGWNYARELLDRYLHLANSMIDECTTILDINDITNIKAQEARRKADSGIDFGSSSERKQSNASDKSAPAVATPISPREPDRPSSRQHKSSSTTLEKIARELRYMRRTKTDVSEMITMVPSSSSAASSSPHHDEDNNFGEAPASKPEKGLRKMKSFSSMGLRSKSSRGNLSADARMQSRQQETPKFDVDELNRQRKAFGVHNMAAVHV